MNRMGSYDFKNFAKGSKGAEICMLNAASKGALSLQEMRSFAALASQPRIVDFGCGTGVIARSIAEALPQATVIGLDPSSELITEALARSNPSNLQFRVIEPGQLRETADSVDMVFSRLVFQHVSEPLDELLALREVLRPGGEILIHDLDVRFFSIEPPCFSWVELWQQVLEVRRSKGGDPEIGLKLPELLSRAGFGSIDFNLERRVSPLKEAFTFMFRWSGILEHADIHRHREELAQHLFAAGHGRYYHPAWCRARARKLE